MSSADLLEAARALREHLVAFRRDLHRHPELSWHEARTAARVAAELRAIGLSPRTGVGGTHGVVADLDTGRPGPTLLLRADMDALPLAERSGLDFASEVEGAMHACGHDAHTTCLLGAARLLHEGRGALRGRVRLVFQPAEEMPPGGAQSLIAEGGVLAGVDAAVALHVHPRLEVGTLGFRAGEMLAHTDRFRIRIVGQGGHGGRPHQVVDAIAVAAQVYQALQYLVSRENDPLEPLVLTIGSIHGGHAPNVIAGEVVMEGTTRCLSPALAEAMPARMERVIAGVCAAARADYAFEQHPGYPALINDAGLTERCMASARALLGEDAVQRLARPELGGEDFAFYAREVPAVFFRLGVGNAARGWTHPLHHPRFVLDEDALPIGAAVMAQIAADYLAEG